MALNSFLDVIFIVASIISVLRFQEHCTKPLKVWFIGLGVWASVSLSFFYWYHKNRISQGFTTKKAMAFSYVLEVGYFSLSILADLMHENNSNSGVGSCTENAPKLVSAMENVVFLIFLRSLRFMSMLVFLVLCGLPIICCSYLFREKRPDPPALINDNLNKVTLGTLF